jgi:unsaturated chondroitin disaccharide hydrolase
MWAYEKTKHPFFRTLFTNHINTVLKVMVRDDYSVRHSYRFDENGTPICEENYCGYAPGSQWARGNAWVVYGLVNAIATLHHTKDMEYTDILKKKKKLEDSERMVYDEDIQKVNTYIKALNGILNNYLTKLPENGVPNWDLKELTVENGALVDTSAAMILASALYKLCEVYDVSKLQGAASHAREYADKILDGVTRDYLSKADAECFIDGGQCGPNNNGCVWGDYFYAEAIMRRLYGKDAPEFWSTEYQYKSKW